MNVAGVPFSESFIIIETEQNLATRLIFFQVLSVDTLLNKILIIRTRQGLKLSR